VYLATISGTFLSEWSLPLPPPNGQAATIFISMLFFTKLSLRDPAEQQCLENGDDSKFPY
jgi:hypothetical protein